MAAMCRECPLPTLQLMFVVPHQSFACSWEEQALCQSMSSRSKLQPNRETALDDFCTSEDWIARKVIKTTYREFGLATRPATFPLETERGNGKM